MKNISVFSKSLFEAVAHYHAIDIKLSRQFVQAVDEAKQMIARFPKIGKLARGYRYLLLNNFPYRLCYREDLDGEIVLITLFHFKQLEPRVLRRGWSD